MEGPMAIDKKLIDQLLTDYKKPEDIIGENGLLKELTKAILERALAAEMTDHLGYEKQGVSTLLCKRRGFVCGDGVQRKRGKCPFPCSAIFEVFCAS
jgi:transposase-like protein